MARRGVGLARNVASSYALRGLRGVSVLALTPYLFRALGSGGFGTWSLLFTVATIFNLVELGATLGVTKHVAELRGTGREDELRDTVGVGAALMAVLGVLALAAAAPLAALASGLAAPGQGGAFTAGLLAIGAAQLVRLPGQAYGATLMGLQRYDLFNLGEALTVLAFGCGAVGVLELGGGSAGLGIAYGASLVLGALTWVVLLRRVEPTALAGPRRGAAAVRRRALGYGWRSLLVDAMDFIAQRMDTLVAGALRGATAAASLGAATRLISGVQSLVLPFANVLLPIVSELGATGRHEELRARLVGATRLALHVTLLIAGGLAIFSADLVRTWLGPMAPAGTEHVVAVLMVVQVLVLGSVPAGRVLLGLGRLRAVTVLAVLEGVGNLGLSVWLVLRWGAIGAAVATLVTSGLLVPLRVPLACRATGCPGVRMAREGIGAALVACLPALAAMVAVRALLEPGALRLVVGLGIGWGLGAALAAAQLGRARLLGLIRRGDPRPALAEPST